jgi:transposase
VRSSPDLGKLSHPEKDALILMLIAQLAAAHERNAAQEARIAVLEARVEELARPPKTPDNSSKPPSQGQKQDRPSSAADRPVRKSRPGVGRTLHPSPDRVVDAKLSACPNCQTAFPETLQTPQQVYERIELPPIKPDVTQVRLFGGRCAVAASVRPLLRRLDWSRVRRSVSRSPRWWSICTTPMPSPWSDWPR